MFVSLGDLKKMGETGPIESLAFLNIENHFDALLTTQGFFIEHIHQENLRLYMMSYYYYYYQQQSYKFCAWGKNLKMHIPRCDKYVRRVLLD